MRGLQGTRVRLRPIASSVFVAPTLTLFLFLWLTPTPARAWGAHGHRIATRVAEARLTPEARAAVRELLREGETLIDIANWADYEGHDVAPGSAPWHYVNVSIAATHYEPRYCGGGNCVVAKIKHFRAVLADRHAPSASVRAPCSSWSTWSRTSTNRCTSATTTTEAGT